MLKAARCCHLPGRSCRGETIPVGRTHGQSLSGPPGLHAVERRGRLECGTGTTDPCPIPAAELLPAGSRSAGAGAPLRRSHTAASASPPRGPRAGSRSADTASMDADGLWPATTRSSPTAPTTPGRTACATASWGTSSGRLRAWALSTAVTGSGSTPASRRCSSGCLSNGRAS